MDQIADKNKQTLWKLSQEFDFPEFVKNAEALTSIDTLNHSVFADQTSKQFPCVDPSNTYISYLYFLDNERDIPSEKRAEIQGRLDYFADFWKVREHTDALVSAFEKRNSQKDLEEDDYALVTAHNGREVRKFPIPNAESVVKAAEYLWENRTSYPYMWRKAAAKNILKKAGSLSVDIPEPYGQYLERAAGNGIAPAVKVASAICNRACLLQEDPSAADIVTMLAKTAKSILEADTELSRENLEKVAQIIGGVDESFGYARFYTRGLPTPEESCFGFTVKVAQEIKDAHVGLITGDLYKVSDIKTTDKDVFLAALDEDVVDSMFEGDKLNTEKAAKILPTLPLGDASILSTALHRAGVLSVHNSQADL
jgi:hypothetical protein